MTNFLVNKDEPFTNINVSDTAYINNLVLNNENTIVVPSRRYPTIQSALNALSFGGGTIRVSPGIYNETLELVGKPSAVAYGSNDSTGIIPGGLKIIGDPRYASGLAYVNGGLQTVYTAAVYSNFPPPFPPSIVSYVPPIGTLNGQVEFTVAAPNSVQVVITFFGLPYDPDDYYDLPGTVVQPDFPALGIVVGDTVVVCDNTGTLYERQITAVSGNTITFNGSTLQMANKGSSITFCPNVQVLNNTGSVNTFNVVNAGITIQGIRFKIGSAASNVRSNLFQCASQVQIQGCVFDDFLTNQTEGNILVTNGATLIGQDRFGGAQATPTYVYDDTAVTQNHNVVLGGGGANLNFSAALKVIGARVEGGDWAVFGPAAESSAAGIFCFSEAIFGAHSARVIGFQIGLNFLGSVGFFSDLIEAYGFSYIGLNAFGSVITTNAQAVNDIDALVLGDQFAGINLDGDSSFNSNAIVAFIQNCPLGINCNSYSISNILSSMFFTGTQTKWAADQTGIVNFIHSQFANEGWFMLADFPPPPALSVPISGELDHVIENQVLFNQPSSGALHMTWDTNSLEGRTFRIKSFGQWDYWTITPVADVSGSLAGKYWTFNTITPRSYTVWYKVSGVGTQPSVPGTTNYIEVDIDTNDTDVTIANDTYNTLVAGADDIQPSVGSPFENSVAFKDIGDGIPPGGPASAGTSGFSVFQGIPPNNFDFGGVFPPSNAYPHTVTLQYGYFYDVGVPNANLATFAGLHSGEYFECVCSCVCRVHVLNSYGVTFSSTI